MKSKIKKEKNSIEEIEQGISQSFAQNKKYFESGQWLNNVSVSLQDKMDEEAKLLNDPELMTTYYIG